MNAIGTTSYNGRFRAITGESGDNDSAEVRVGKQALLQAVNDLKILCGYGLVTREGRCKPWPKLPRTDNRGHSHSYFMNIAGMRDPNDHRKLRKFFLDGVGQQLCDWVNFRCPAPEIFWRIVRKHGAKK